MPASGEPLPALSREGIARDSSRPNGPGGGMAGPVGIRYNAWRPHVRSSGIPSMILRILAATFLSAVVLFGWGYLFWVVSPFGAAALEAEPFGGEAMVANVSKVLADSGVYFMPNRPDAELTTPEQLERFQERHREGPLVRIFYNTNGADPDAPTVLVKGFVHNLAIAFLIAVVLALAAPALPTYTQRLGFVFLVGAVAAVWLGLNEAIWFYHPWKYELYQAGYVLVGGLLMGLVLAALVKRPEVRQNGVDRRTVPL